MDTRKEVKQQFTDEEIVRFTIETLKHEDYVDGKRHYFPYMAIFGNQYNPDMIVGIA